MALVGIKGSPVVTRAREQEPVFGVKRRNGQARAAEPAAFADERFQNGNRLAAAGVLKREFGWIWRERLALLNDALRERMADAIEVCVSDASPGAVRAWMDVFLREWISGENERVLPVLEFGVGF